MKKIISLIKASMSEGMSLFKIKKIENSNIYKKIFPIFIYLIIMVSLGSYMYLIAKPLSKIGLTHVMLSMMIMFVSMYTIIEGFYKSQGMLFECKDNDLLLSLPIDKKSVFFVRIFKFYIFQLLYDLLFILPAYCIYIYFIKPGFTFYVVSIIMVLLLPIIPIIIASLIGYIIKLISVNFKKQKSVQTIISMLLLVGVFYFSFNIDNLINNITNKASLINDAITNLYYPINLYISLINKFSFVNLIKLILINIIPFIIFIYIASIYYFKIIFKTRKADNKKAKNSLSFKKMSSLNALIKKEFKSYFSLPVYIVNTLFGMVLLIILTILLCTNVQSFISLLQSSTDIVITPELINKYAPFFFYEMVLFTGFMSCITCCSISLEGKSFNLLKSFPISYNKIFLSKIIFSNLLVIPVILICDLLFILYFKVKFVYIIYIMVATFIVPILSSLFGLFINLKYPKLKWNNETEVIKQSTSTMICTFTGMILVFISIFLILKFIKNVHLLIIGELVIFSFMIMVLCLLINTFGKKSIQELSY